MVPLNKKSCLKLFHQMNYKAVSYLHAEGNTVNAELEENYFKYVRKCLAEIWSAVILDNYPIIIEYSNIEKYENLEEVEDIWFSTHIYTR